jgi:CheY-like chemotaxis protein
LFESFLGEIGLDKKLIFFDSGKKALQYLNALCRPDFPSLIVLDYHMPGMSGKDILEYLKYTYRFSNIPVIVYSTKMNENMKYDLIELGAIACFRKTPGYDRV